MNKEEFENIKIIDWSEKSAELIADLMNKAYQAAFKPEMTKSYVYCGITNDFVRRSMDHQREHWEINDVITVVDCGTKAKAGAVEGLLHDRYDFTVTVDPELEDEDVPAGGNGGTDAPGRESSIVYLVVTGKTVSKTLPEHLAGMVTLANFLKNIGKS